MSRRRLAVFLAAAALAVASGAAAADLTREEALAALRRTDDAEARRAGAKALSRHGTMADVAALARALHDSDREVRSLAEDAMWQVWSRTGDEDVDRLFAIGVEQMNLRDLGAAAETFSQIIGRRPEFAEGWNKRATVYYLMGEYEKSLADCDEVMKRNAWHWGALSGYGMIYLQLGQLQKALEAFERALGVNPNMDQVRAAAETIRQALIRRRRDAI